MKPKNNLQIAFLIVGTLAALEFIFVRGLFTWLLAVGAVILVGGLNILLGLKNKEWMQVGFYLLLTVSLCMGYFALL